MKLESNARIDPNTGFIELHIVSNGHIIYTLMAKASLIIHSTKLEGFRWSAIDIKTVVGMGIKSILSDSVAKSTCFVRDVSSFYKCSKREKEVLALMLQDLKIKEIAEKTFTAVVTVKTHIGVIYSKMGVKSREEFDECIKKYQIEKYGYESYLFSKLNNILNA